MKGVVSKNVGKIESKSDVWKKRFIALQVVSSFLLNVASFQIYTLKENYEVILEKNKTFACAPSNSFFSSPLNFNDLYSGFEKFKEGEFWKKNSEDVTVNTVEREKVTGSVEVKREVKKSVKKEKVKAEKFLKSVGENKEVVKESERLTVRDVIGEKFVVFCQSDSCVIKTESGKELKEGSVVNGYVLQKINPLYVVVKKGSSSTETLKIE